MEWDYSGRKGRDGQKKKIGKANERKGKVKRGKDEEVNGQGGKRGALAPHGVCHGRPARKRCDEIMDWCSRTSATSSATYTRLIHPCDTGWRWQWHGTLHMIVITIAVTATPGQVIINHLQSPLPGVGPGHSSFPLIHLLPHLFPFHFLSLALPIFFFCPSFPFYQNSRTQFPGLRS